MTKEELREKANDLPLAPGVYLMMDKTGRVIYVGKAKKLKNRVSQYFQDSASHTAKTRNMVSQVDRFDTIFVTSEFEALVLENSLIKRHMPRYNILLKDDKGYPFVRLSKEAYPRFSLVNKMANDSARYFGPFGGRFETRQALDAVCYMVVAVNFGSQQLMLYSMKIRTPKLVVMLITAFAIGGASIVFQSIINNTIVTPCLLGMNSLYTLIHTAVVFFAGSGSLLARSANLSFAADVILMGIVATIIYSYLFQKTNHNVLYVLLIGTVLSSFFSSIQTTLTRVMDPNEYDSLLSTLVADFENINSEIIVFALVLLAGLIFVLRRDLALLDVLTLGKHQAINLGVDYDRSIRRLLLGVTLCIAVATAMVGPISFLGLIIANIARQLFKTYRHTYLILGSALVGMVVLVAGQLVVERIYHYAVPISVFITVGGGVYFLYLLLSNRRV